MMSEEGEVMPRMKLNVKTRREGGDGRRIRRKERRHFVKLAALFAANICKWLQGYSLSAALVF